MYFHPGFAARNAIAAIELAEAGAAASETILEGEAGLFAAFPPTARARRHPSCLPAGEPEIMAVYNKPAPACNFAQTAAQAALRVARELGDIGRDRDRLDPRPRGRGPLSRLRFQGALPECAAGQDEHSFQRRRRARARCARGGQLRRDRRSRNRFASSTGPICKASPISPPHSLRTRAPRSSSACATERPSVSASTMSSPRRRSKSGPAFERPPAASSATDRARRLEQTVDDCASLADSRRDRGVNAGSSRPRRLRPAS